MGFNAFAQIDEKVLDEIVAVVGENIVLRSELEAEYVQAKATTDFYAGDLKCEILNQLIVQKLYLHKGELDSIYASSDRVEAEVDRRIKYYTAQIGGEQKLEKYLGKSIAEYKDQMKGKVEQQMIIQQVQQALVSSVKVSPTEVRKYFNDLPKDSLPTYEKEIELAQITRSPKPNQLAMDYAREKIEKLRNDVVTGKYSFEFVAKTQSDDKGTAVNGGELGYFSRGQMVGPFERMAFKLKKDSVSEIIETEFGYHILQLIDRKGEKVNVRHILIKPLIVKSDYTKLEDELNALIIKLKGDSITLCNAAAKYSDDPYTKDNCGYFTDQATGSQRVPVSSIDPAIRAEIIGLDAGEYTSPKRYTELDGSIAYRFFYLNGEKEAHKANLKDDYQKIQNLALEVKQEESVLKWVDSYKKGVYVWIDDKYKNCDELKGWKNLAN